MVYNILYYILYLSSSTWRIGFLFGGSEARIEVLNLYCGQDIYYTGLRLGNGKDGRKRIG